MIRRRTPKPTGEVDRQAGAAEESSSIGALFRSSSSDRGFEVVRRKDRAGNRRKGAAAKKSAAEASGKGASDKEVAVTAEPTAVERWFTVAEAAELLEVSPSRIFDGIRDGKLRVRFRAAKPGAAERPLVSSDELVERSTTPRIAEAAEPAPTNRLPAEEVTESEESEAANGAVSSDVAPDSESKSESELVDDSGSKLEASSEDDEEQAPSGLAARARRSDAPRERKKKAKASPSPKNGDDGAASKRLVDGLEDELREAKVAQKVAEEGARDARQGREHAESELRELKDKLAESERARLSLAASVQEAKKRADESERQALANQRQIDRAEDQIEQSLKAVYERDVKVARLEAQLEASTKVRAAGDEYVEQLQGRLTKVEDRAEEKEREIRRLALGLGEARGEIRHLRPPLALEGQPATWRRTLPWAALVAIGVIAMWITWALAQADRGFEASVVSLVAVSAAFVYGLRFKEVRIR